MAAMILGAGVAVSVLVLFYLSTRQVTDRTWGDFSEAERAHVLRALGRRGDQ